MNEQQTAYLRIGGHRPGSKSHQALVSREDLERLKEKKWTKHRLGYAYRYTKVNGKWMTEYLHRVVAGLDFGDERVVDHINNNRLDNRRENLRVLESNNLNLQNRAFIKPKHSSSRFRGVCRANENLAKKNPTNKIWKAQVQFQGQKYQERFRNEVEAALAAEQVRRVVLPYAKPDPELLRLFRNEDSLAVACEGIKIQNLDLEKIKKYS